MPETKKKQKCPDCDYCQMCSENRCRLCRSTKTRCRESELGSAFTFGEYEAWRKTHCNDKTHLIDIGKNKKRLSPVIEKTNPHDS
jgi:hypothetical protein